MEMVKEDLQKILVQMSQDLNKFHSTKVKCGIIGRSGTGKSSLINAIVGEYIAEVGEVETTTEVKPVEHKGLIFYDLPGCSTTSFPKEDYIDNFEIKNFDCVIIVS
jgi:predicted GTPase